MDDFFINAIIAVRSVGSLHYYAHERVKPAWAKTGFRFILGQHTFVKLAEK
jgi:hypothetical protein